VVNQKIKKILVPMDGSKNSFRGLDMAIYLARQCGGTITGLFVMPNPLTVFEPITFDRKYLSKFTNELMSRAKERCAQNGIVFNGKTTTGDIGTEIMNFSQKNKYDTIVMGARGLGSVKEAFLGSVSHAVVHKSKIPVLIIK
jgi:nucleotide-binding universal stress UspA family protein